MNTRVTHMHVLLAFVFNAVFFLLRRLVEIAMEAMDLLLQACHAQTTLNLFVESFLRMVQKLLEDSNPNLQIMATNSVMQHLIELKSF